MKITMNPLGIFGLVESSGHHSTEMIIKIHNLVMDDGGMKMP